MSMFALLCSVFGGLAIFVYGMKLMSDGLHEVAGERMQSILRMFSANRFVAILSGTVVTAVIQSSSASTVMVIGFVNAGLLGLVQAIGIIFGANIGTTVTAQIVAFDISSIIMPAIIVGLLMIFIPRTAGWGTTILGLGFLFLGMEYMSSELKTLADNPAFLKAFSWFDCEPVNGYMNPLTVFGAVGVGLVATMIIQSSSACSGIVIALGASGVIDLYTAVALILGSNIGTTVTAQLAALTANRVAKQAALAHTLFNVIGVLICCATFWIILPGSDEPVFFRLVNALSGDSALLPRKIANAHTVFNVCTTLILTGFIPLLAKVCEKVIPVGQEKVKFQRLEPHLLETPEIALLQTVSALRKMLKKSWKNVSYALRIYDRNDERNQLCVKSLDEKEDKIDMYQKDITDYLSRLMQHPLTPAQSNRIPKLLHCTNDAERIGDHAILLRKLITDFVASGGKLSEAARAEFADLIKSLDKQMNSAADLLENYTPTAQGQCIALGLELKRKADEYEENHLCRLKASQCNPETGIFYIELISEMRKVSRHAANIVERAAVCCGKE